MSEMHNVVLSLEGVDSAEANRLVQGLQDDLERIDPTIKIQRRKPQADTQDFGTTLVLLFGTPVAIALANGIAGFLKRHSGASITISTDGAVVARNLNSEDAAKIATAFGRPSKAKP
jgi:hypothetical protein